MSVLEEIKGGLVVSCQALENEPLHGSEIMAKMAKAAEEGGAIGIRANSPQDIKAIKKEVDLPLIGIEKTEAYDPRVYITPTFKEAKRVWQAGTDIIAIDATKNPHPQESLTELVQKIHEELKAPVMGDISILEEGIKAEEIGIDVVGTTLSGYTEYSRDQAGPDFELLKNLVETLSIPVIMEGKIRRPEEVKRAIDIGAHAVVVGTAITRPQIITAEFAEVLG